MGWVKPSTGFSQPIPDKICRKDPTDFFFVDFNLIPQDVFVRDYPGGGPNFTSSKGVVGTWKTSVSKIGCAINFPSTTVTMSRGS